MKKSKKDNRKIETRTEDMSKVISIDTPVVGDTKMGDGKIWKWPFDKKGQRGTKGID